MFQKSIEAIISQGVKDLERLVNQTKSAADEARAKVSQCQSEIQSLVTLGKQVPDKVFDRYTHVLVGTITSWDDHGYGIQLVIPGKTQETLRGLMGDETLKKGKYRAIVLLEPIS